MSLNKKPSKTKATEWSQKIKEVEDFAEKHSKWPSTLSDDEHEKAIAQWWSHQKYYIKQKESGKRAPGINDDREKCINDLIKKFAGLERDGSWETKYRQVKTKIITSGSLWSYKTTDPAEKKLNRWFHQQSTFYRKFRQNRPNIGGMTEERAQKIEKLLGLLGKKIEPKQENQTELHNDEQMHYK